MKAYVLDTHILWWYLTDNIKKLSPRSRRAFEEGERGQALLYVPVLILAEIWDVNQNHGHLLDFTALMHELQQAAQFVFVPFDIDDVFAYADLSAIPGNRDRLIVTACRKMDAPLITVDEEIIESGVVEVIQ